MEFCPSLRSTVPGFSFADDAQDFYHVRGRMEIDSSSRPSLSKPRRKTLLTAVCLSLRSSDLQKYIYVADNLQSGVGPRSIYTLVTLYINMYARKG